MKGNLLIHDTKKALIFTVGLFALLFWLGAFQYETNDDMGITALLKGQLGLTARGEGIFISPLLGNGLFLMYKVIPALPWFSLILYTGLALVCFLGSLTVLISTQSTGGKTASLLGVGFIICLTAFQMNFSAVSLLLWVSGCIILLRKLLYNGVSTFIFGLAISQLAMAYLLRPSFLPLLILLATPLLLHVLLYGNRSLALRMFAPLILMLVLGFVGDITTRTSSTYSEYDEFNKVRSEFTDSHRSNRNDNTPLALFVAKWRSADYEVFINWWLHDGVLFSTERINSFLAENAKKQALFDFRTVTKSLDNFGPLFTSIFALQFVVLFSQASITRDSSRAIIITGYLFILVVVLTLTGVRFPMRVAYPCLYLLFLHPFLLLDPSGGNGRHVLPKCAPTIASIIFITFFFIPMIKENTSEAALNLKVKTDIDNSLVDILESNGSNSFIIDVNPHILPIYSRPFQENDTSLRAHIMPSGWLIGSPAYLDFLEKRGLGDRSTVVPSLIDNPRAIFRFWDSKYLPAKNYIENHFLRHLQQNYTAPDKQIMLRVLKDFRQQQTGLIYFHLVTYPKLTRQENPKLSSL